ncbi:cytochrome P450 [Pleurocapsales cyanobacterium LEGE 06147]|nr:cytochrome P450 [Pleurocapsales cyanobacterium LEGE 06147]
MEKAALEHPNLFTAEVIGFGNNLVYVNHPQGIQQLLTSDRQLRDELMTLMLTGHETTATAIAWALYWIHRLPKVRQQLLAELEKLDDFPSPMEIAKLPYLTAVCQETLRIYPVAMLTFPRVVQQPMELLGYELEPGTVVVGSIYLTHQREDLYPEPKQFKPERFLESISAIGNKVSYHAVLPSLLLVACQ